MKPSFIFYFFTLRMFPDDEARRDGHPDVCKPSPWE